MKRTIRVTVSEDPHSGVRCSIEETDGPHEVAAVVPGCPEYSQFVECQTLVADDHVLTRFERPVLNALRRAVNALEREMRMAGKK